MKILLSEDATLTFQRSPSLVYRIAGIDLYTPLPFPHLAAFIDQNASKISAECFQYQPTTCSEDLARIVHQALGWIGNRYRLVTVQAEASDYSITIEGIGHFCVQKNGSHIIWSDIIPPLDSELFIEALTGPAFLIAAALQGVWALHAGAAMYDDHLIAFVGESGVGKSTLARFLGTAPGWKRVSDDILPMAPSEYGVIAHPQYPQLKLPSHAQPSTSVAASIPLRKLVVIRRQNQAVDTVSLNRIPQAQAMAIVIRHTVAAKLFDRDLLIGQMEFAARLAETTPVYELVYPRKFNQLPLVASIFQEALEAEA